MHKFDSKKVKKLDSPERRRMLPPEATLQAMGCSVGQKVLDVGCGVGFFAFPVAEIVGRDGFVYGVDINPDLLQIAVERQGARGTANLSFFRSQENTIPLPDAIIDLAVMVNVLHEAVEPHLILAEVKRVLKPSGRLGLVDWAGEEKGKGPPAAERVPLQAAEELLAGAGFAVLRTEPWQEYFYLIVAAKK